MQAIETKYIPASNYRGSRIKATCERGSITVSYDDALNGEEAHIAAAQALGPPPTITIEDIAPEF